MHICRIRIYVKEKRYGKGKSLKEKLFPGMVKSTQLLIKQPGMAQETWNS